MHCLSVSHDAGAVSCAMPAAGLFLLVNLLLHGAIEAIQR